MLHAETMVLIIASCSFVVVDLRSRSVQQLDTARPTEHDASLISQQLGAVRVGDETPLGNLFESTCSSETFPKIFANSVMRSSVSLALQISLGMFRWSK